MKVIGSIYIYIYVDMMMARKTIVLLVGYLFIGVGGLDNSELYWENGFESSSWSLLLVNTSVKEYIAILWAEMNDDKLSLFIKSFRLSPGSCYQSIFSYWCSCDSHPAPPHLYTRYCHLQWTSNLSVFWRFCDLNNNLLSGWTHGILLPPLHVGETIKTTTCWPTAGDT